MNILGHQAVKQLIDSIDAAAITDLNASYNSGKYDGYGPDGYGENIGFLHMTVDLKKNEENKIVRTIAVDFSTVTGETQEFNVPKKVTVTEILPEE